MTGEGEGDRIEAPVFDGRASSEVVVDAVAEATGRDPLECPPLYGAVDPDALDDLVAHDGEVRVDFEYAGCEVTIRDGTVTVSEA